MASVIDLREEERALGGWPRRLLHVPTMTSYEWQPGNKYNSIAEPSYNAISYTWGRWRLRSDELPDCPALAIRGVPWDIPRIHPSHFSASQLQAAIRTASNSVITRYSMDTKGNRYSRPPDFVWIDIACIDQRKGEPRSTAEVGRQAEIFKGATQVFSWLSSLSRRDISLVMEDLENSAVHIGRLARHRVSLNMPESGFVPEDYPASSAISMESCLNLTYDCFRRLLADPWFSSLWTLQEAFLRPSAVILSREGITVKLPESISGAVDDVSLADVTAYARGPLSAEEYLRREENIGTGLPTPFDHIKSLVEKSGITELRNKNPLVVYIASGSRETTNTVDRIYGIQQIFDIRVGKSSPRYSAIPDSKEELEIQFGEQLLLRFPVLSQMHVFIKPAPFGRAWLVSSSSRVPTGLIHDYGLDPRRDVRRSVELNLSIEQIGTNTWGRFEGSVCAFSSLSTTCVAFERARRHHDTMYTRRGLLSVFLDATQELQPDDNRQMPDGESQKLLADWLLQRFGENGIEVLHLGLANDNNGSVGLGLLLLRRDDPFSHYHRIGICWWELSHLDLWKETPATKSVLIAEGRRWRTKTGLFG